MPRRGRGRPRKVRHENDDGASHRIWDITDWALFDTEGNLDEARLARWKRLSEPDCTRKLMIAKEIAPNMLNLHGQARVSFNCPHSFVYVTKLFASLHVEVTKATDDWSYFLKFDSEILIDVDNRKQGQRNVFKQQLEVIKNGGTVRDCMELPGANYQSVRAAELLMKYHEPPRPQAPRTVQYTPPTEWSWTPDSYVVRSKAYWDGYDAHSTIVINNLVCKYTIPELAQIIGVQPHTVSHGRQARWDHVIITACDAQEKVFLRKCGIFVPLM